MAQVSNLEVAIKAIGSDVFIDNINAMKEALSGLTQLAGPLKELGAAMSTYITLPMAAIAAAAVLAATATDELKQALENVGGKGAEQFRKLTVESDKLGLGISSVAKAAISLEAAGISNETTARVLNGIGEAVRKMGGGDAEFNSIAKGLERIAATGTIAARQIKQMETTAPEVKKILLDAFGTDVPKSLEALGLTTEEFFKKFADSAAKLSPHVRTIKDSFTQLKNDTETALGNLGDTLIKDFNLVAVIDNISKFIKTALTWFSSLSEPIRTAIEVVAVVLGAGGPLMLALAGVITIMPMVAAAFSVGLWPLTLIVAGVAGVTFAVIEMNRHWTRVKEVVLIVQEAFLNAISWMVNGIGGMIQATGRLVGMLDGHLQKSFYAAGESVKGYGDHLKQAAGDVQLLINKTDALAKSQEAVMNATGETKKEPLKLGTDPKEKVIKDSIAEVKEISEAVSFAQLEADIKAAAARVLNATRLTKIAFGDTIAGVLEGENKLKAFMNTLSIGTMPSIVKMGKDTATALKAGGMVSKEIGDAITDLNKQITDIVNQGMANVGVALGGGLGKAFEKGNFKDLGKGLLDTIGGIMTQLGTALIGVGVAIEGFKMSLKFLNGPLAIAAGIALVAAGTVFTDVATAGGSSTGGMSSSASSNNSGGGDSGNMNALMAMVNNSNKMQLTTKIAGSDLLVIMSRAGNSNNRTS